MKSIILKSLETNSTTIIPNFGAIMKMGKSTLFNEFLKYDDGKLAQVYASEKAVSLSEAKENINKFITEITTQLDAGNSHVLEGIGTFSKVGGKLKFVADKISGTDIPAATKKPAVAPTIKKDTPAKEIVKPKEEKVNEVKTITPKKVEVKAVTPKKETIKSVVSKPLEKIEEIKSPKAVISSIETKTTLTKENKIKKSVDFLKDEAITKINDFTIKDDLIDFTRDDKRKTVIDALNKKLTNLNTKVVPTKIVKTVEKVTKPIVVAKKVIPAAPIDKIITPEVKVTTEVPVQKTKIEIKKPEVKIEKEIPKVALEKPVTKVDVKKPEVISPPIVKSVIPKVETPPVVEKTKETIKNTASKTAVDEKVIAAISTGLDKTDKETKKRKRRRLVLWLAMLCILIGVGIFGYLKQDMVKGWFGMNNEVASTNSTDSEEDTDENEGTTNSDDELSENDNVIIDNANDTESDSDISAENDTNSEVETDIEPDVIEEPEIVIEPVVEPEPIKETPVAKVSSATGSYHLVAGSYSSEANAEKKVKKLNKLGYPDAAVLGKFGGLYKVKIASYDSKSAANSAKSDLKAKDISSTIKKY